MARDNRCTSPAAPRVALVVLNLLLVAAQSAAAATFQVTNLSDSGAGSLRQAVLSANAAAGNDNVTFAPGLTGTITLTSGEILISDSLIVQGPGAFALTIDANHKSRIFYIAVTGGPIDVTLSGLTLTEGGQVNDGGAVMMEGENLTILDSVISNSTSWGTSGSPSFGGCGGNVASWGGTLRIANSLLTSGTADFEGLKSGGNLCLLGGQLLLERSTVTGGSAGSGGGIALLYSSEEQTILHSTISGNHAEFGGGGILNFGLTLTIDSSTISGNTAENGGGVFSNNGLQITNSTISGNAASAAGGGITTYSLLLRLTTMSNNTAGTEGGSISGIFVEIDHSIVANGTPQDLIGPNPVTANYSLIENPGTVVLSEANNLVGIDPLLGPLANNGGPTLTHAPLPGSPVIDTGNPSIPSPPAAEQRGFARIVGPAVDRGSVEQQSGITEVPTLSQVGLLLLSLLLLVLGVRRLRQARALVILFLLLSAHGAAAATFQVTNLSDSGPGSLRQAVLDANATAGADEVTFAPGLAGTINLTSGEILISDDLVVQGPGVFVITVDANYQSRIFRIESGIAPPIDVTLSGLRLTRGFTNSSGGAVVAYNENLTILDSVISSSTLLDFTDPPGQGCGGNVALNGGSLRIANSLLTDGSADSLSLSSGGNLCVFGGELLLERSTVSGGSADHGGGLALWLPSGERTILHSTISGNHAEAGGGILNQGATLTIDSSTISGNTASDGAGVLAVFDLRLVDSTISGNVASQTGGGLSLNSGSHSLRLTTISNNTATFGGGSVAINTPVEVELDHAIVANGAPQDLAGFGPPGSTFTVTANYSLVENPGTVVLSGANNLVGIDPLLGPLANNGGPTLTHAPLPGSPVIDTGNPAIPSPPATDQRGFARIVGPAVDRGSVEQQSGILEVPTLSQVGLLLLSLLLLAFGVRRLRQVHALVILFLLISAHGAAAATFQVTNLLDSGPGSLRQAVLDANGSAGPDDVTFAPGLAGTITLTSGYIWISDPLFVHGPGAGIMTVSGNESSRIFVIVKGGVTAPMDVTLSGLTLTRGYDVLGGGAVSVSGENLTILDSVVSDSQVLSLQNLSACGGNVSFGGHPEGGTLRIVNSLLIGGTASRTAGYAGYGSGGNLCFTGGRLILERSTITGGSADEGGGIAFWFSGESQIILSTISGNHAEGFGGGIFNQGSDLTIDSSTIFENTAGDGGGVLSYRPLRIINSTISGNSASSTGGGIWSGPLFLRLTTISNNTAGTAGGSILLGYTTEIDHSIVANGSPQDLAWYPSGPTFTVTANYSLIEAPGTGVLSGANNLVGVDPLLGPLANNGGPTLTHAPLPGSPVLDAGNPAIPSPPPTDQRGLARIVGPAVDLGSVEQQLVLIEVPTLSQVGVLSLSLLLLVLGVRRLRQVRALIIPFLLLSAHGAAAATFQVTNLSDSGPGSLRQAVLSANAAAGPDQVTFAPGLTGTITLTSGEILIRDPLVVSGPGAFALTVDANHHSRIFNIGSGMAALAIDVTLSGLTLTRGFSTEAGGAVAASGNLTILDSVISQSVVESFGHPPGLGCGGNVVFSEGNLRIAHSLLTGGTVSGGAFAAGGNLCVIGGGRMILERSTVSGGSADAGGGLFLSFPFENRTISHSTISGNHAINGGGICNQGSTLTIESSTISGNTASEGGGVLSLFDTRIVNSTISGNIASDAGGGIFLLSGSHSLLLTTISNNTAGLGGGSIFVDPFSEVELDHAIVANGAPQDLSGQGAVTANYSLIEAPGDVTLLGGDNLVGVDPLLGPLANIGGPTLTHAPLPGSPVLDAGNPAIPSPPPTDQRGFARIVGPAVDLGSVEQQPVLIEVPTLSQVGALVLSVLLLALGVRRLHTRSVGLV